MIIPHILAFLLILLLLAIAIGLLIYLITLPLFIQIWIVDLFGDPRTLFPVWLLFFGGIATYYIWRYTVDAEPSRFILRAGSGLAVSVVSTYIFAGAWAGMKRQHQYYNSQDVGLSSKPGSLCYDYATGCLLWGNTSPYQDQTIVAVFGALLFYAGIIVWSSSTNQLKWNDYIS